HLYEIVRDVLEQAREVYFLLIIAAQCTAGLLAHDGHHRLMVELGVIQPVQQMDRTGPGRGHAYAHLAGELGMGARHESRRFFVARLDELQFVGAAKRADQAIDAVARISVHATDAPLRQPREYEIGYGT